MKFLWTGSSLKNLHWLVLRIQQSAIGGYYPLVKMRPLSKGISGSFSYVEACFHECIPLLHDNLLSFLIDAVA